MAVTAQIIEKQQGKEYIMPRGDRTGPVGAGPMTGRAAGFCSGYSRPGFANPGFGRGYGMGRGGWGRRNRYYATGLTGWQRAGWSAGPATAAVPYQAAPEQELQALQDQAKYMQETLEQINKRIRELEDEKK